MGTGRGLALRVSASCVLRPPDGRKAFLRTWKMLAPTGGRKMPQGSRGQGDGRGRWLPVHLNERFNQQKLTCHWIVSLFIGV